MKRTKLSWMNGKLVIHYLKVSKKKGFSLLAGINRDIKPNQVDKLARSIKIMGVIRPVIVARIKFITGRVVTYIIDGQHLYLACLKLGIDIPYAVIEVKDMKDLVEKIAMVNSSSRSWTMGDYVLAWSNLYDDYKKLNGWIDQYNIEVSVIASVMAGKVGNTGELINRNIKSGDFRIKNEAHNLKLLNQVKDLLGILPRASRFETKYLCKEYITFVKNCPPTGKNKYIHAKFLEKVKNHTDVVSAAIQAESKLSETFNRIHKKR